MAILALTSHTDIYKPQVGAYRVSHARPDKEKENLIISKDLVEIEELEFLGHIYKEIDGKIFLDPTLTSVTSPQFVSLQSLILLLMIEIGGYRPHRRAVVPCPRRNLSQEIPQHATTRVADQGRHDGACE